MRILITIIFTLFFSFENFAACIPNSGPLATVIVDNVTVKSNGDVEICWQAGPEPDIIKYYIYGIHPITGAFLPLDSVVSPGATCYTILAANNSANINSVEYAIVAKDACANSSETTFDFHNTVFLEDSVDICSSSIILNWNAYDNFHSGMNVSYIIYASENGGPFIPVGDTNLLEMTFSGIQQGSTYDIYIEAIEKGGTGPLKSTSNIINVNTTFFLIHPNFLYLYSATVVDSQQVDITFYADTAADIKKYEILRANSLSDSFHKIGEITAFNGMDPLINFSDFSVEANLQSYVYTVKSINICDELKITSNIAKTILVSVSLNQLEAFNTLTISSYEGWLGGVRNYEIYRSVAGVWETNPIGTLSPFTKETIYTDNIGHILTGNGKFCYKVIANEKTVIHVGNLIEASSVSNSNCVNHSPFLYVPNAFIPNGNSNTTFIPTLTYAEPASYLLIIYDRWGGKLFETNDVYEGWDGDNQPVGPYVYSIYFQSNEGEEFHKRGTVALLR